MNKELYPVLQNMEVVTVPQNLYFNNYSNNIENFNQQLIENSLSYSLSPSLPLDRNIIMEKSSHSQVFLIFFE